MRDMNYTFHDWVRDEHGPFTYEDDLEDFIREHDAQLSEDFEEWCRQEDAA